MPGRRDDLEVMFSKQLLKLLRSVPVSLNNTVGRKVGPIEFVRVVHSNAACILKLGQQASNPGIPRPGIADHCHANTTVPCAGSEGLTHP